MNNKIIYFIIKVLYNKMQVNFIEKDIQMLYKPKKKIQTFYQICKFENKYNKINVRKINIDEFGNFSNIQEKDYHFEKINKFIKNQRVNKYKLYPTNDLSLVSLPNPNEIFSSMSELLNKNNNYTGFSNYN